MTHTDDHAAAGRLTQIATEVGDAWLRCRGPLTGLKALVGAQNEAISLGAGPEYLSSFTAIVQAAKVLEGKSPSKHFVDARRVLETEIARLRREADAQQPQP